MDKKTLGPEFAKAKATALRAIANVEWDAPVPDMVRFFDDHDGFVIRLSYGDNHAQRAISWLQIKTARANVIAGVVDLMLQSLAQADFDA